MGIEDAFHRLGLGMMDELGFSKLGFFWSADYRARAEEMLDEYGDGTAVLIQYVWQGGGADLREWQSGYKDMYDYWESREDVYVPETREEYTERVRKTMVQIARNNNIASYLKCPFMKVRMMNLSDSDMIEMDVGDLEDMICYIANGVHLQEWQEPDDWFSQREEYMERVGLLKKQ